MSKSRNVCECPPISQEIKPGGKSICWSCFHWAVCFAKKNQPCVRCSRYFPAADVVEVDEVAKILTWLFADHCPCNYNDIDEWLPCVCELSNECPQPKDEFGCWKQFIKHHKAKMDGGVDNA